MKKLFPILMVFMVVFNTLNLSAFAESNDYDHAELMDYKGYGEALYEGVVRETTYLTGQYTENKEYVSETIDEIVDYAKFWWNEGNKSCSDFGSNAECLKGALSQVGGYVMTVGDWVKNLFNGYFEKESVYNSDGILYQKEGASPSTLYLQSPYKIVMTTKSGEEVNIDSAVYIVSYGSQNNGTYKRLKIQERMLYATTSESVIKMESMYDSLTESPTYSKLVSLGDIDGFTFRLYSGDIPVEADEGLSLNAKTFTNYINTGGSGGGIKVATPKPSPYLSCPDGTKIQMSIDGSTFLKADGTVMQVNKDGTATVDSSVCNLGWTVPEVKYDEETEKVVIQDPKGEYQDVETGEVIGGGGSDDGGGDNGGGDGESCDSVLCNVAKIFEAIGSFFEKLMDFVIKIFIPEDTTAIRESFDSLTSVFNDKFAVMTTIKETFTNSFNEQSSNTLEDYYLTLPILNNQPLEMFNFEYIDFAIPIAKKFVGGVTIIFTLWYVYRKITGNGGVMEK